MQRLLPTRSYSPLGKSRGFLDNIYSFQESFACWDAASKVEEQAASHVLAKVISEVTEMVEAVENVDIRV